MIKATVPRAALALLGACILVPALAARQVDDTKLPGEKVTDRGRIDWGKGELVATGLGAIPNDEPNSAKAYLRARGFAKLDALRNVLMVIDHVRIDSQTTGADYEAKNDEIRAEVKGIVRGARVIAEKRIPMGNSTMIEVTVEVPMYGEQSVASAFLPEVIERNHTTQYRVAEQPNGPPVVDSLPSIGRASTLPPVRLIAPSLLRGLDPGIQYGVTHAGEPVTSLIIDARGAKVGRCMSPKIRRTDGTEIWGSVNVDPDYVIEHGIVSYAHSISEARKSDRAGSNPLIVRAVGGAGARFVDDAVVSDEDAEAFLTANKQDGFLDKFHVVFIVDQNQ